MTQTATQNSSHTNSQTAASKIAISKVAIIGAGIAGLTALQDLAAHGASVTIFDKSRGSGGRISSKKVGESSWDMGAQFMRAHTSEFAAELEQWSNKGWVAEWPVTPWIIDKTGAKPSPDNIRRFVGMPRMTGLSRGLLGAAAEFITQTRIVSTEFISRKTKAQWYLTDDNDQRHGPFDTLVINVPPEQVLPLLPANSPFKEQIQHYTMQPCWTLLLGFSEQLTTEIDAAFVKTGPLSWIARNTTKPGRAASTDTETDTETDDAWVIQASHEWSQAHVDASREDVLTALTQAFADSLGIELPSARDTWLHRWLFSIPTQAPELGALYDSAHNLAICGDWCQQGSIEGAWISGKAAARQLLNQ